MSEESEQAASEAIAALSDERLIEVAKGALLRGARSIYQLSRRPLATVDQATLDHISMMGYVLFGIGSEMGGFSFHGNDPDKAALHRGLLESELLRFSDLEMKESLFSLPSTSQIAAEAPALA